MNRILTFLLALSFITSSCNHNAQTREENETASGYQEGQATQVEVILLRYDEFSKELSANGQLFAVNKVDVRSKFNEPVINVLVSNGQWVNAGQLIAVLDTFELYHAYIRQRVLYEKAQLAFSDAMLEMGFTEETLDQMPAEQRRNAEKRSGIELAKTDYLIAKNNYQSAFIRAPIDGQIANLNLTGGNYPINGFICSVIDNREIRVDFLVLEAEASLVRKGLNVEVSPFFNEQVRETATITSINPTVEDGLILVSAELEGKNPALLDGATVKVYVKSAPRICLAVPKEAIVLRTGRKVVFTYNKGRSTAQWNYVETGEENSTHVEITEGLNEMDTVIVAGNLHLGNEVPCVIVRMRGLKE